MKKKIRERLEDAKALEANIKKVEKEVTLKKCETCKRVLYKRTCNVKNTKLLSRKGFHYYNPRISLSGLILSDAGFKWGQKVTVLVYRKRVVIKPFDSLTEKEKRHKARKNYRLHSRNNRSSNRDMTLKIAVTGMILVNGGIEGGQKYTVLVKDNEIELLITSVR